MHIFRIEERVYGIVIGQRSIRIVRVLLTIVKPAEIGQFPTSALRKPVKMAVAGVMQCYEKNRNTLLSSHLWVITFLGTVIALQPHTHKVYSSPVDQAAEADLVTACGMVGE